jgi:predicted amidohydrolase YtcJ
LALVNGKIHTMDAGSTVLNAVTIRNGRFVTVGGAAPAAGRDLRCASSICAATP